MTIPALTTRMTMAQALRRMAEDRPAQEAVVCGTLRLTYDQLQRWVERAAADLGRLAVGKGDRVVLLLPPGAPFITLFFAAAERGAVVVPLDPAARPAWMAEVVRSAAPAVIAVQQSPPAEVIQALPQETRVLTVQQDSDPLGCVPETSAEPAPVSELAADDLLAVLYTSGSTGLPKGTMHTHRSLIAPVVASLKLRELWVRRPTIDQIPRLGRALLRYRERLLRAAGRPQVMLSTVGYHTITGVEAFLQALLMGDALVIQPHFDPEETMDLIQRERVTVLIAVPTALAVMLRLPGFERYDLSSLLICGTGSAPCPPELAREVQRRFGCALHIGFGSTELGGGIAATSLGDSDALQAETVGRPMPGVEVRVLDEEGRPLPPGAVGELVVRTESVMAGYWDAPDLTAEALSGDGWYHTGDLVVMDEQGYLRVIGRKKDVIIRGGRSIQPGEIERHLLSHPAIREVAVVGVPGGLGGEQVWAFVRPEEGAVLTSREVRQYCRGVLQPYQAPQRVSFVDDFPRSSAGKPQKYRLRQMAMLERGQKEEDR
jgi:fatty-acyl-CoA synthase